MIKINLLPPNIFEARIIKRLIAVFVVILIMVIGGCLFYVNKLKAETQDWNTKNDDAQRLLSQANQYSKLASDLQASADPMIKKAEFFENVAKYNKNFPKLYETIAKFTYKKVIYSQLSPASNTVTITAYAPSLSDAGRYLLNMYRATHLFSQVAISGVPGFPQEGQAGPGGGGVGAIGVPPMPTAGFMTPGGGGGPQSIARVPTVNMNGMPMPAPTGMPGIAPANGPGDAIANAIASSVAKAEEKRRGFNFTVTLSLTTEYTLVIPVPPSAGGATPGVAGPGMTPGAMPSGGGLPSAGPGPASAVSPAPSGGGDAEATPKIGGGRGGGGE
jgi:hypothetical protein